MSGLSEDDQRRLRLGMWDLRSAKRTDNGDATNTAGTRNPFSAAAQRHRAARGVQENRARADRTNDREEAHRRGQLYPGPGGSVGSGGGHGIQSMAEDFPRVVSQGQAALQDGAAALRQQVAAIVDGSPSHQAVKDAAEEWARQAEQLAARGDDVIALSRQADAAGYEAQERYGSAPNRGAWLDMGG